MLKAHSWSGLSKGSENQTLTRGASVSQQHLPVYRKQVASSVTEKKLRDGKDGSGRILSTGNSVVWAFGLNLLT